MHYYCVKSVRIRSYSYFPSFGLNTDREMRTRITLNMDTFHTVLSLRNKSNSKHFLGNIPQRNLHEVFAEISKKKCFSRQPRIQTFRDDAQRFILLHKKCPYSEFFWSVFCRIQTQYGEMLSISIVFSANAGKHGTEKLRIRTLSRQCLASCQYLWSSFFATIVNSFWK